MIPINHKGHILVVDDDPVHLQLFVDILTGQHYYVQTASSGQQALLSVQAELPDLILLDIMMPGLSGFDLCRQLKAETRTRDIPIIFVTGLTHPDDKVKAFAAGGVDYVTKPIEVAEVLARVETQLSLRQMRRELEELVARRTAELQQEIAERQQVEAALRESEARYRALVEASPLSVLVVQEGRYVFANPAGARRLGYAEPAELVGVPVLETIGPEYHQLIKDRLENVSAGWENPPVVIGLVRPDGSSVLVESTSVPINLQGQPAVLILGQDLTERFQAQAALQESEARLKEAEQVARFGYYEIDILTGQAVWSDGTFHLFGLDPAVGAPTLETYQKYIHSEDIAAVYRLFEECVAEKKPFNLVYRILNASGEVRYVHSLGKIKVNAAGDVIKMFGTLHDITERKQAEESQRRSEERFRSYFELSLMGVAITSIDKRWLEVNDKFCDLTGYTRAELIQMSWPALTHPDDLAANLAVHERILAGEIESFSLEKRYIRRDGQIVYAEVSVRSVHRPDGAIDYLVAVVQDITARKQAEEALKQSEATLKSILRAAPIGIGLLANRTFIWFNDTFEKMVGYTVEELAGQSTKIVYSDEAEFIRAGQKKYDEIARAGTGSVETRFKHKDGRIIDVLVSSALLDPADPAAGVTFAAVDITARNRAEAEIRRRNRELSLLNRVIEASATEQTPQKILELACRELALTLELPQAAVALVNDQRTETTIVAEYFAEGRPSILGVTFPVAGTRLLDYLLEHKAPLVSEDALNDPWLAEIRDLLTYCEVTSQMILPMMIEETLGALTLGSTKSRRFSEEEVGLAQNVTNQVVGALARARLAETHRRLMTAIEQTPDSVVITDLDGRIIYVNPAFEQITGYSRAEALGQNPRLLKSGQHNADFYREFWAILTKGQVWRGQLVNKKKDGSLYTEEAIIAPVRDERGAIINYIAVKRDVTRELRLEEQYRQAQRLETVGRLAGGVAHDFNNILTVIGGYAELLLTMYYGADDPRRGDVEQIQKAAERAGRLTRQLLAFSRQQTLRPEIFNLNTVVINLEKMLRRLIGEDVELVTELAADLWQIKADPGQMEQVLMNLVVNARDAMPQGGRLTLATANLELDERQALDYLDLKPGGYVMLRVTDTGVGMDADTRSRIFEPFFTTKEAGRGTGLGLATVYGIIQQSGGQIYVDSTPGQGTTFTIYLPTATARVDLPLSRFTVTTFEAGKATILLLEDEAAVRLVTRKMLEIYGYTVLEADGPERALEICRQHPGQIDLLITDVIMPRTSGPALASRLIQVYPQLKVLFISGYTNEALAEHGLPAEPVALLEKPFSPESLAHRVRQVLNS